MLSLKPTVLPVAGILLAAILAVLPSACGRGEDVRSEGGFCQPGNPVIGQSSGFGNGNDCDTRAQAEANAMQDWVSQKCSGNWDPQCPSGCVDTNRECTKVATYDPGTISCGEASDISTSICSDGTRWECTLAPVGTKPATCDCDCL